MLVCERRPLGSLRRRETMNPALRYSIASLSPSFRETQRVSTTLKSARMTSKKWLFESIVLAFRLGQPTHKHRPNLSVSTERLGTKRVLRRPFPVGENGAKHLFTFQRTYSLAMLPYTAHIIPSLCMCVKRLRRNPFHINHLANTYVNCCSLPPSVTYS